MNYYNDNDPGACAWLAELVKAGCIPEGTIDPQGIQDVTKDRIEGFEQCHFFAGIGGWPYAMRLAGWTGPVWTASCPCQPFSNAGKRKGQSDERHLWPVLLRLIRECRPPVCFGEQVNSDDGYRWLARVRDDLEAEGYAVGCADLPACSQGAPHIRGRLWWVAQWLGNAGSERQQASGLQLRKSKHDREAVHNRTAVERTGETGRVADANGRQSSNGGVQRGGEHGQQPQDGGVGGLEYADHERRQAGAGAGGNQKPFWTGQAIRCTDGKSRRIEPAIFPLDHGIPGRVGLLRGAGNAIVPQVAAHFVRCFLEAKELIYNGHVQK